MVIWPKEFIRMGYSLALIRVVAGFFRPAPRMGIHPHGIHPHGIFISCSEGAMPLQQAAGLSIRMHIDPQGTLNPQLSTTKNSVAPRLLFPFPLIGLLRYHIPRSGVKQALAEACG